MWRGVGGGAAAGKADTPAWQGPVIVLLCVCGWQLGSCSRGSVLERNRKKNMLENAELWSCHASFLPQLPFSQC